MENVAMTAVAFVLVLGAVFTSFGDIFRFSEAQADALAEMRSQAIREADGYLTVESASSTASGSATDVDVTVANRGRLKYAVFKDWDVTVRYEYAGGESVTRLPYSPTTATSAWTVHQIWLDEAEGTAELIDPGVLDPLEEMVIRLRLSPRMATSSVGLVTVTPPDGNGGMVTFDD